MKNIRAQRPPASLRYAVAPGQGEAWPRPLRRLGQLPVRQFLAHYWQRRPVVIRQALPGFESPVTRAQLFDLAGCEHVESRLVQQHGGACQLRHGPFRRSQLPALRRPDWTLLVQGVDHHDDAAAGLVARFRFLPDARLDDLMLSYASDGGGVGPHIDSYDVFLLQALGRRRWRIQYRPDPTCVADLPIQRLARFHPDAEWLLEAGDLLYLPPGIAHDGTAVGESITCSVGFRTPSLADLTGIWAELLSERPAPGPIAFRDAGLTPASQPARLPARMIRMAHDQLARCRPSRADIARALLRQLSEPKPQVAFERPRRPLGRRPFENALRRRGLRVDRRSRMLYSGRTLAINGELLALDDQAVRTVLKALADRRALRAGARLSEAAAGGAKALVDQLYQWYLAGWICPPN